MVAVSLQLCLFFCLGWLIVSPGVATEQEEVNDTDQSKHQILVQHEIVANGKNSKEDNHESVISSSSRKLTAIISPRRNRSTWHQNDYLCDIQHALDTVRALADHRMSLETILRICSIRTGFLANTKLGSTRVLRRIERDAILPQQSTIYFNNPKHLKRILNILRQESKLGTENHTNRLGRLSKISKRSTDRLNDFAEFKDKRQPLDRIDEPSEWRDKLQPKYARFFDKRQPLDRIDEPSEWRDKLQPKYARFFDKRQPLDRIDEPSEWRDKLQPKYAQYLEKRQPLDRIDEPSEWRDKLQPKYARFFDKRQPLDRIDEPSEGRDKLQPRYSRPVQNQLRQN